MARVHPAVGGLLFVAGVVLCAVVGGFVFGAAVGARGRRRAP